MDAVALVAIATAGRIAVVLSALGRTYIAIEAARRNAVALDAVALSAVALGTSGKTAVAGVPLISVFFSSTVPFASPPLEDIDRLSG